MPTPIQSTRSSTFPVHRPSSESLDLSETARLGFHLRLTEEQQQALATLHQEHAQQAPHERRHLEPEQADADLGTDASVLSEVASGLGGLGLEITEQDAAHRQIYAEASLSDTEKALGIELYLVERGGQTYRTFDGPVHLPDDLGRLILDVSGLDTVPVVSPDPHIGSDTETLRHVRDVARLYDFPLEQRGAGQTAVIILPGGGYHEQDLDQYFASINLPKPHIEAVGVAGASNNPASSATIRPLFAAQAFQTSPSPGHQLTEGGSTSVTDATWTIEATSDVEILGSLLPEARIVVIFTPNTQADQAAAMQLAVSSDFAQTYGRPSVISCSWGQYEYTLRASTRQAMETQLQRASALGITVCFSSGDIGGGFVYYPASSQYVLCCGGTSIVSDQPLIEHVWREHRLGRFYSAGGGGLSATFDAPSWQADAVRPWGGEKRGLPDLAGHAGLDTGYRLFIGGVNVGIGGTSCVAPLMAGLVGQINGANADLSSDYRVGWLTPLLYGSSFESAFSPVTEGSNGLYSTGRPWDPCTGLGRPIGTRLARLLRQSGHH